MDRFDRTTCEATLGPVTQVARPVKAGGLGNTVQVFTTIPGSSLTTGTDSIQHFSPFRRPLKQIKREFRHPWRKNDAPRTTAHRNSPGKWYKVSNIEDYLLGSLLFFVMLLLARLLHGTFRSIWHFGDIQV
jgi:hypothetical protein